MENTVILIASIFREKNLTVNDEQYLETFLEPIRKCKNYRPKFGQGNRDRGFSLNEFKALYEADPFYSWIGLDNDLMYSAHRAAGGMTSIYRQVGVGCERLLRQIIMDTTGYISPQYCVWSYTTKTPSGKTKKLSLDGRLELEQIRNREVLVRVNQWIQDYCSGLGEVTNPSNGIVFEVRQGYKSKDSKRQNADIDNATVAWANSYLPIFAIFSSQIDLDIVLRYRNNRCGILIGNTSNDAQISLYAFCHQILGYDLAGFFEAKSKIITEQIGEVLEALLSAE